MAPLSELATEKYECELDDTVAVKIPRPETKEEEDRLVELFLSGMKKLFKEETNWLFLQPLLISEFSLLMNSRFEGTSRLDLSRDDGKLTGRCR